MATLGIGAMISMGGALIGGIGGMASESYQADVARRNAAIMEINSNQSLLKGQNDAQDNDFRTSAAIGQYMNQAGGSGLSIDSRSVAAVSRSVRSLGQIDSERLAQRGLDEAANFKNQKAAYETEAGQHDSSGLLNLAGGVLGAAGIGARGGLFTSKPSLVSSSIPSSASVRFRSTPTRSLDAALF